MVKYYDNYTFTTLLKDASGSTSIIYKYDPEHTPIASANSSYHTSTDLSYIRFHNQIFSVDMVGSEQQYITHAYGNSVDASLNIYIDGEKTDGDVLTNISNIPFIGNYSEQTVWENSDVKVLDLFKYYPSSYNFVPINDSDTNYTNAYRISDNIYEDWTNGQVEFKYVNDKWEKFIYGNHTGTGVYYNPPIGVDYKYDRIHNYKYPTTNINNILTSRGTHPNPKNIATELVLPSLP